MSEGPMLGQDRGRNRGCTIAALVGLVLFVALLGWVYYQYKRMPWVLAEKISQTLVATSSRPEAQKKEDLDLLMDLIAKAKAGEIGEDGLDELKDILIDRNCFTYMQLFGPQGFYVNQIKPSALSDQEKAEAEDLFKKLCIGVREGVLQDDALTKWAESIPKSEDVGEDGRWTLEQAKKVIAGLKGVLTAHPVPAGSPPLNYEYWFESLLNKARKKLGRPTKPVPATQPAATQPAPATAPAQ